MVDILFLFLFSAIPADQQAANTTNTEVEEQSAVESSEEVDPLALLLEEDAEEVADADDSTSKNTESSNPSSMTMTDESLLQKGPITDTETIAVLQTNKGAFALRFFSEEAPKTVENFLGLAEKQYYDGIIFHRVIDGFMIQGGDPTGTGTGGESLWGEPFEDEFSAEVQNKRGSISMANAGPATNGSQFFVNTVDNLFLDNRHSVFGEVIAGMETVDAIVSVETAAQDKPVEDVVIESVSIIPFSEFFAQ